MTDPNSELLQRAGDGDARALRDLLQAHLPTLVAYVRLHAGSLLREKESCGDLVQSVCLEVLQNVGTFEYRGEAPFRKWLRQMTPSELADRQRRWLADKRDPAREESLGDDRSSAAARQVLASFTSPSQVAIRNEDLELLEQAFQKLPEEYREVVTLARLLGYSHAQIAQQMGRSDGAVRVLLHRACVRLGWLMSAGGSR